METFFGVDADELTRQKFFRLLWQNRQRIGAFLKWCEEMENEHFRPRASKDWLVLP